MSEMGTRRLVLTPWTAELAKDFVALLARPELVRFGYGRPPTPSMALGRLSEIVLEWETNGFGAYAIRERESGVIGGYAGVHVPQTIPELAPLLEVGVRVVAEWWGKALAFEAMVPIMNFAFEVLNAPGVAGVFLPANTAARNMNQALGMSFHSQVVRPGTGMLLEVHRATRDDWQDVKHRHGLEG
ncbi:GNAT family N-acetyltransferase [Dactylosporangium sp. CA-139114]|uniref:GNAT family N-acetyltransferase n=1 Tax=Dactylosporangium sp. CA-139114 TaxID=3239931 RepID=UPI003D95D5D3